MIDASEAIYFAQAYSAFIAHFLTTHGPFAVFISAFFFGEVAILVSFILSGQGLFTFWDAFLFSVAAILCADMFWFLVARFFPESIAKHSLVKKPLGPLDRFLQKFVSKKLFLSMLFFKFVFGTRLVVVLYLGRQSVSYLRFLVYDIFGSTLFVSVLAAVGWLLGKGIYNLLPAYSLLTKILLAIVLVLFITFIVREFYRRYLAEHFR